MSHWPDLALTEETHFDGRVLRCFAQRPPHLPALLARAAQTSAGREALIDGDRRWTWTELADASLRLAHGLAQTGLQAGDRVALLMGNSAEFVIAVHAITQLGAVAVPLSTREAAPGVAYIVNQCQAAAVLADGALQALVPATLDNGRPLKRFAWTTEPVEGWSAATMLLDSPPLAQAAQPDEEDAAVILYTSGTTGKPKGAVLTHLNLIHSVLHYQQGLGLTAEDRSLLAVPGSHVTGLVAIVLAMAGVGGCVVILREFKAATCLATLSAARVSCTLMVPAMYALCVREAQLAQTDLSAWRLAGFGGAPMPPATIDALRAQCPGIRLFNAYGATETSSPATMTPPGSTRVDTVGVALPCADIRIMDDDGQELPRGQSGEVWIAGPMVVPRYWDNPQGTQDGFCRGYWKSGDIGTMDAQGYVQVHDRKKDMINRGGYKVFSVEVENWLLSHPAVQEVATVGVPCPVLGERIHAFVYAPGGDTQQLPTELRALCRRQLADYKAPDAFTWLDQPLPRNANGKLLKRQLREQALAALAASQVG